MRRKNMSLSGFKSLYLSVQNRRRFSMKDGTLFLNSPKIKFNKDSKSFEENNLNIPNNKKLYQNIKKRLSKKIIKSEFEAKVNILSSPDIKSPQMFVEDNIDLDEVIAENERNFENFALKYEKLSLEYLNNSPYSLEVSNSISLNSIKRIYYFNYNENSGYLMKSKRIISFIKK